MHERRGDHGVCRRSASDPEDGADGVRRGWVSGGHYGTDLRGGGCDAERAAVAGAGVRRRIRVRSMEVQRMIPRIKFMAFKRAYENEPRKFDLCSNRVLIQGDREKRDRSDIRPLD